MTSRTRRAADPAAHAAGISAAPSYHHGALREALLVATEGLLLEQGVEAFTLRACARRAGVSHAAPAHHFGDARGLLTAFATVGFNRMAALMRRYRDAAPQDPVTRLQAVGQAYIDFALANRAHFQLMFSTDRLNPADAPMAQAAQATAEMLGQAMAEVMTERQLPAATLPQRLLLAWSAVHGFATLVTEGQCNGVLGLSLDQPKATQAAGVAMLDLLGPALAA